LLIDSPALSLSRGSASELRDVLADTLARQMLKRGMKVAGYTMIGGGSRVFERAHRRAHLDGVHVMREMDGKYIAAMDAGHAPGSLWEKLPGALLHQSIETGSEMIGGAGLDRIPGVRKVLDSLTGPAKNAVLKQAVFQAFVQRNGVKRTMAFLSRGSQRLEKAGVHSVHGELAEEVWATAGHTVFEGEEFHIPSPEEASAMVATILLTRGAMTAGNGVMGGGQREGVAPVNSSTDNAAAAPANVASADEWKPVTGGGIYVEEEGGDAQKQERVRFSGANAPRAGESDVNALPDTFEMLRTDETSRRGAAVPDKDLNVILQTMASRAEAPERVRVDPNPPMRPDIDRSYVVTVNEGGEVVVNIQKDGTVWVDTQGLRKGEAPKKVQGGDLVYQGGLNYAHSNELVFVPDPREVTPVAQRRRISHMASSALRHGTTRHFNPYHADDTYNTELPPRSEWREEKTEADYKHNLNLLLRAELNYVDRQMRNRGKSLADLRYDPKTDTVWQKQGGTDGGSSDWRQLSQKDYAALVTELDPGRSGVGATTLARALLAKVRLEGQKLAVHRLESLPSAAHDGRGLPTLQPGSEVFRLRGTVEVPNHLFYSRGESSGSERVQRTGVTRAETSAAEARLKSTAQGRAIFGNVLIVDSREQLDGQQGRPSQQRYHAEDLEIMRDAEGFHDPRDGTVVIFRQNVRVLEGETAAQAMARVVVHERVGHHGFDALRASDSTFAEEWKKLAAAIPADQMKKLEASYTHLNGNREALALEWFAHQVGNMGGRAQLEPGSVTQRMWQVMRDWVTRQFNPLGDPSKPMTQELIDAHVRGLIRATQRRMVKGAKNTGAHGVDARPDGAPDTKVRGDTTFLSGGRAQFSQPDSGINPDEPSPDKTPISEDSLLQRLNGRVSRVDKFTGAGLEKRVALNQNLPDGEYLFVVDESGAMWTLPFAERLKHNSLVKGGEKVKAAGEITIENGMVDANARSGHFYSFEPLVGEEIQDFETYIKLKIEKSGLKPGHITSYHVN
jgi:hypothetical protein